MITDILWPLVAAFLIWRTEAVIRIWRTERKSPTKELTDLKLKVDAIQTEINKIVLQNIER